MSDTPDPEFVIDSDAAEMHDGFQVFKIITLNNPDFIVCKFYGRFSKLAAGIACEAMNTNAYDSNRASRMVAEHTALIEARKEKQKQIELRKALTPAHYFESKI